MKAQGFTLIELLAVIVILAIIALIATPIVLSIIEDAKESAMLRSAEMYLNGVENAVMKENMNNGGNFRPNKCIISNGSITCDEKLPAITVEVDGEVPSTGSIVFKNGKIKEVTLNYESGTIVKDLNGKLVYEGSGSENEVQKVTVTPKKETYTIGEEVTIGEEHFYVIADDADKVTLLAKDCINTVTLVQDPSAGEVKFATESYWGSGTSPYDIVEPEPTLDETTGKLTLPASHTAAKAAYDYGAKIGGIGRLMTHSEATALQSANSDILYGINGKSSSASLYFWLGSAREESVVCYVDSYLRSLAADLYNDVNSFGVRPVVEISKTNIS